MYEITIFNNFKPAWDGGSRKNKLEWCKKEGCYVNMITESKRMFQVCEFCKVFNPWFCHGVDT